MRAALVEAWVFVLAVIALAVGCVLHHPVAMIVTGVLWTTSSLAGMLHRSIPCVPLPFGARGNAALEWVHFGRVTTLSLGLACVARGLIDALR